MKSCLSVILPVESMQSEEQTQHEGDADRPTATALSPRSDLRQGGRWFSGLCKHDVFLADAGA